MMRVCSPAVAAGVAGKAVTEQQVSFGYRRAETLGASKARRGSSRLPQNGRGTCSVHSSAGSVPASPDRESCRSYARVMLALRAVMKETWSF